MTVSEFIALGERQIKDAVGTRRWGTAVWITYLNTALKRLWGSHPEAFYVSTVVTSSPTDIASTATATVIPVLDEYLETLIHDACSWILSEDSESAGNMAQSNLHYQKASGA